MKLKETKNIVESILNINPRTRDCDNLLIVEVYEHISPGITERPFKEVAMLGGYNDSFPTFETIRRTRQKVQEKKPHLRANKEVEGQRLVLQHKFFDFALKGR